MEQADRSGVETATSETGAAAAVSVSSTWALPPAKSERGHRRREAILDAATAEFLQKGYNGASLRAIMAVAGGSSRTLYQQFGDKAGLFRAIVARLEANVDMGVVPDAARGRPIEDDLFDIGLANINTLLKPPHLDFFRMMVAESAAGADIPTLAWSATHKRVLAKLTDYLIARTDRDGLVMEDPEVSALQFLEASKGAHHLEAMFSGVMPPQAEIVRRVRIAVDTFLNGVRRRPLTE